METKKELTELEKAQEIINAAEKVKTDLFQKEYKELCEKHGYKIDATTMLVIRKS